jgi:hypothetical protein
MQLHFTDIHPTRFGYFMLSSGKSPLCLGFVKILRALLNLPREQSDQCGGKEKKKLYLH